jgi:S1-C subfamily serine protease
VILAVNGQAVTGPGALTSLLAKHHPGDHITVSWMDTSGQRHTAGLTLIAGPLK